MARRKYPLEPITKAKHRLGVGDSVQLIRMPKLNRMPSETKVVFRQSLGRTFEISGFERNGLAELFVRRWETIYVEPEYLRLVRRGRRVRPTRRSGRAI
jgi:hypothetical protein